MSSLIKNGLIGSKRSIPAAEDQSAPPWSKGTMPPTSQFNEETRYAEKNERLREEAIKQGYAEGSKLAQNELRKKIGELEAQHAAHEADMQEQVRTLEENVFKVVTAVKTHGGQLDALFETRLVLLALECLYKLAGRKDIYKEVVEESIRRRLGDAVSESKIAIRLPQSSALEFESLATALEGQCILIFDSDLKPGDCLLESGFATEDTGMMTLLEQMKDNLVATLEARLSNAEH